MNSLQHVIELDVYADGTNIVDRAQFYLLSKDSLTNSYWATNSLHSVTGAVTRITETNNVPQRFYKVAEKDN